MFFERIFVLVLVCFDLFNLFLDFECRVVFCLLFLCFMVIGIGNNMLFVILLLLVWGLGVEEYWVGVIYILLVMLFMMMILIWGVFLDWYGCKFYIVFGLSVFVCLMLIFVVVVFVGENGWILFFGVIFVMVFV